MQIELQKESNDHHWLRCKRGDGSVEEKLLETKSFLQHDLIHLSVELEAGLQNSFWGQVAQGKSFQDLMTDNGLSTSEAPSSEMAFTEIIVGAFTAYLKHESSASIIEGISHYLEAFGSAIPEYLDKAFIEQTEKRYRALIGEWNALVFGEVMRVDFLAKN